MENNNNNKAVNYRLVFKKIWERRRLFYIVLPITFVLSSLFIICIPRGYTTETAVAPETEEGIAGGALSSLAGSFGIDIGNMQASSDAITPILYPDLMEDNGFVASLLRIHVKTLDESISTDYYTYLKDYCSHAWWEIVIDKIGSLFEKKQENVPSKFDPYHLSRRDEGIMNQVRDDIEIGVNKKTNVISIVVTSQDAMVSKMLADSVRMRLQDYITDYRTNKAREDYKYYDELATQAKNDYEAARRLYDDFSDSNMDIVLQKFRSKQEDLENDLQLKYNTYSGVMIQLNAALAKIQDRTPAFTTIKGASVPIKPAKPKRMLFVLGCVVLAFIITSIYVLRSIILPENT